MILNEAETSLHPNLIPALGRLILAASARTQLIVVTHNDALAASLEPDATMIELTKELGETKVVGQGLLTTPTWHWGKR